MLYCELLHLLRTNDYDNNEFRPIADSCQVVISPKAPIYGKYAAWNYTFLHIFVYK